MLLNKPAYMFGPLSVRLRKAWKRLCICENKATITRLCKKLRNRPTCRSFTQLFA